MRADALWRDAEQRGSHGKRKRVCSVDYNEGEIGGAESSQKQIMVARSVEARGATTVAEPVERGSTDTGGEGEAVTKRMVEEAVVADKTTVE